MAARRTRERWREDRGHATCSAAPWRRSRCARRRRARSRSSGWWLFQFWQSQHLRRLLVDAGTDAGEVTRIVSASFFVLNAMAIVGNFGAGWLARRLGNRRAIVIFLAGLGLGIVWRSSCRAASTRSPSSGSRWWDSSPGYSRCSRCICPRSSRRCCARRERGSATTWARSGGGVHAVFGLLAPVNDYREALLYAGALALVAAAWSWGLPEGDGRSASAKAVTR